MCSREKGWYIHANQVNQKEIGPSVLFMAQFQAERYLAGSWAKWETAATSEALGTHQSLRSKMSVVRMYLMWSKLAKDGSRWPVSVLKK